MTLAAEKIKIDLHLHTPASRCFADPVDESSCRRLVERARQVGLQMVAVTDHHSVACVQRMRQAAEGTSLVVLPGVELSTRLGEVDEVFFLALFSPEIPEEDLRELLEHLGIDEDNRGNCHYRLQRPLEFIIREVQARQGLLISDHLDKTPQRRRAFAPLIHDYGIRLFDLRNGAFASEIERMLPAGERAFCFTFSDAHGVEGLGKVFSELPLRECSWQGFKEFVGR